MSHPLEIDLNTLEIPTRSIDDLKNAKQWNDLKKVDQYRHLGYELYKDTRNAVEFYTRHGYKTEVTVEFKKKKEINDLPVGDYVIRKNLQELKFGLNTVENIKNKSGAEAVLAYAEAFQKKFEQHPVMS